MLTEGPRIADLGPEVFADGLPEDLSVVDCEGHCLAPGLVDMRVQLREPGEEHKETIQTASWAAAAGGVTTMVALPNTEPVIDDVAGVEFVARRAREVKLVKVFTYGSVTRRARGQGADRARPAIRIRRGRPLPTATPGGGRRQRSCAGRFPMPAPSTW